MEKNTSTFIMPSYYPPNFSDEKFINAPNVIFAPAPKKGVAPDGYHATSIFPEYFKVNNCWLLAEESRMDSVAVLSNDAIRVVEFRNLEKDDLVAIGRTEHGENGIYLHTSGFTNPEEKKESFAFRTGRSRETAYSKDYDNLYRQLNYDKDNGKIVWVMGPACTFDYDSRKALSKLISDGYVGALLAGNALATHDLEAAYFQTALGQDIYTQGIQRNGHYNHLDILNMVRSCGSIQAFIEKYKIDNGIIYHCLKYNVPFVLTGSIRDDGPLPEVYADVYNGQNAMRNEIRDATTVISMATVLHSIASGNMTPSYRVVDGIVRPTFFYCIDISEFSVNKLSDRGSLSVKTFVTNVQDFIVTLERGVHSIE